MPCNSVVVSVKCSNVGWGRSQSYERRRSPVRYPPRIATQLCIDYPPMSVSTLWLKKAALITVALLAGTALQGQEKDRPASQNRPTLKETTDWLSARLLDVTRHRSHEDSNGQKVETSIILSASFEGCAVTLVMRQDEDRYIRATDRKFAFSTDTTYRFSLADVSLGSAVVKDTQDEHWTPSQYPFISLEFSPGKRYQATLNRACTALEDGSACHGYPFARTEEGNNVVVPFDSKGKDLATRITSALSHAITLCGGKPEPF